MKVTRKMVHIDEDKCNGCGLCIPSCAEGALQIIDGKAKLVSDVYCDGLGACLGDCPLDAISIIEREAEEYDEVAVEKHLVTVRPEANADKSENPACGCSSHNQPVKTDVPPVQSGCPGMAVKSIARPAGGCCSDKVTDHGQTIQSELTNWPVQITLMPPVAPYLNNAKLLISADCVPLAYGDFHKKFIRGRVAVMGCPKLDDGQSYIEKLTIVFARNNILDLVVPYMEVPCCGGLLHIVKEAVKASGKSFPVTFVQVGINGTILGEHTL
jgi:NAD-dependent dihydropyrimidine dehydrogenase PreA subunit